MLDSVKARPRSLDLIWRILDALRRKRLDGSSSGDPGRVGAGTLPAARLRDLGFEADQVGGNIDLAKAQHHRFP